MSHFISFLSMNNYTSDMRYGSHGTVRDSLNIKNFGLTLQ